MVSQRSWPPGLPPRSRRTGRARGRRGGRPRRARRGSPRGAGPWRPSRRAASGSRCGDGRRRSAGQSASPGRGGRRAGRRGCRRRRSSWREPAAFPWGPAGSVTAGGTRRRRSGPRPGGAGRSGRGAAPGRAGRRCRRSSASCRRATACWMPWTIRMSGEPAGWPGSRLGRDGAGDEADEARAVRPHHAGGVGGHVAQVAHRRLDRLAGPLADRAVAVEHAAHGLGRDAGARAPRRRSSPLASPCPARHPALDGAGAVSSMT